MFYFVPTWMSCFFFLNECGVFSHAGRDWFRCTGAMEYGKIRKTAAITYAWKSPMGSNIAIIHVFLQSWYIWTGGWGYVEKHMHSFMPLYQQRGGSKQPNVFGTQGIHNSDVIMGTMASQITSLTIVYSIVYSGEDRKKSKPCVTGICEGNSPLYH